MNRRFVTLAFTMLCEFGSGHAAEGATRPRNDPELLAALRSDAELAACRCVLAAAWIDESYPRVTVDAVRWQKLRPSARVRLGARALKIAEATYLVENAATDQYERLFVVDGNGKSLFHYQP